MKQRIIFSAIASLACSCGIADAQTIVDDSGTARNGKVGYWSSMVARHGDVAISYYCEDDQGNSPPEMYTLRFAWASGTSWQWTTVDPYFAGSDTSMARGTDGVYQIVYQSGYGIGWAKGAATAWTLGSVAKPPEVAAGNISMVLDSDDHPHVAYMNLANGGDRALRYAYFDGTAWVDGGANSGIIGLGLWTPTIGFSNTYLALDSARTPHVAFAQPSDPINAYGEIKYATLVGGASGIWQFDSLGVFGEDPSLAIGSDDTPRMAFNGDAGLVYAYKSGGVWQFETVVAGEWASSVSMALSDQDLPVLSFGMTANEDMYVARREPGGWIVTRIDGDQTPDPHMILGRYGTSVDVDEAGTAHVGYLAIDIYGPTHRCDLRYFGPGGGPAPCVQITSSPVSANHCELDTATFSVAASSGNPLNYEWRRNGVPLVDGVTPGGSTISGADTAYLSITGATASDVGPYACLVSADCGTALSASAALTIVAPAFVTSSPVSTTVCTNAAAMFAVSATGSGITYAWYHDGAPLADGPTGTGSIIAGAATANVTISGVSAADAGNYDCAVFNLCGSDSSASATLTVSPCSHECTGDLNEDGQVNLADLATLLAHYGDSDGVAYDDGDINLDDRVDLTDLAMLLSVFGTSCP